MQTDEPGLADALLEANVWVLSGQDRVLVAKRYRRKTGEAFVVWCVASSEIRSVLWTEWLVEGAAEASGF